MRAWAFTAIALAGCASGMVRAGQEQRQAEPGSPDAGSILDASTGDPGGDADFRAAANRALVTDPSAASAGLEAFLDHHPSHPGRTAAAALLARVHLGAGDAKAALAALERYAPGAQTADVQFVSALAQVRLGKGAQVVPVLHTFEASGVPAIGGVPDPDANILLHAATAEALAAAGDAGGAIDAWDLYLQNESLRVHERAFARRRAEEIANAVSPEVALQTLASKRRPLTRSMLGAKAAVALRAVGDEASAGRLEQDTGVVRRTLAIDPSQSPPGPGDPLRFGLAIPLSGPQSRLGEVVLRSAALVIGTPAANGQPSPYHLLVRDSAAPTDRAPAGPSSTVWNLSRDEGAVGIVGTPDPRAIELATREGLPFLLLDERAPGGRNTAFQLIHSPESRAAALASRALQLGARRFAILGPDTPAGKRLAAAFRERMSQGGAAQAAAITYPAKATAFSAQVKQLHATAFDVLFVPDDAARLELIAPALAVSDIWPRQPRQLGGAPAKAGTGRREILLMSTALSLSQRLLQNAERYVQGAMLCPGYYPAQDARGGNFASRFHELYGTAPTAADAYGYDGLAILRSAVERGARTKADVLRLLDREAFEGVTGDVRFGPDHARIDPPAIYVVEGDSIRTLR